MVATISKPRFENSHTSRRRSEMDRVENSILALCESLEPGVRIPPHRELMQRFAASERTVLRVLDDIQRRGRIVRRMGSGTYVADGNGHAPIPVSPIHVDVDNAVVALAIPDAGFFDHAVELLHSATTSVGLDLVCRLTSPGSDLKRIGLHHGRPRGFIVLRSKLRDIASTLYDDGQRVVLIGQLSTRDAVKFHVVQSDLEYSGYLAAKHLLDLGHETIAYVNDAPGDEPSPRLPGVERAVDEAIRGGRIARFIVAHYCEYQEWMGDSGEARSYFTAGDAPTGLIAWNDDHALSLIGALRRASLDVPGQVSVIGHDNMPFGETSSPRLTTIDSAIHVQLKAAIDLLMAPEPPAEGSRTIVVPGLIVRDSTSSPKR